MADRNAEFAQLYAEHRLTHQRGYYAARRLEYEAAERQGARVSSLLLALSSLAGWFATFAGGSELWGALGAGVGGLATAVVAYRTLYSFERLAKLYGDAEQSLGSLEAAGPPTAATVEAAEAVMQREQGQWGQLVEDLPLAGDGA